MRRKMMPTRTSTSRLVYNKYDDDQDSNKYFCCCMLISSAHHHHHHRLVLGFAFLFFFLVIAGKIYTTTAAAAESTGGTYFQEHSISKNNHTTPTTTSLAEEDDDNDDGSSRMNRIGAACSKESIYVFQGPTLPLPNGIPTYTVEIENVCASAGSCSIANIHLSCGWFSSARLINPNVFRRICYDDCLVNNGEALSPGESLSFQYANTFQYPMSVSSVACY